MATRTRGIWPNGRDPWAVWSKRPPRVAPTETVTEQEITVNERKPSENVASIAGRVLAGQEATEDEVKSLAASVLSQRNG